MIDLHILTIPGRERSLARASASARHSGINIHVINRPADGNINAGRVIGYGLGCAPYVACLDDDDELTGSMDEAIDALESDRRLAGAYYDEIRVDRAGDTLGYGHNHYPGPWRPIAHLCGRHPHHIAVLRREALAPRLHDIGKFTTHDIFLANTLVLDYGALLHIEKVRYRWTIHDGNTHALHSHDSRREVQQYLQPTMLNALRMPAIQ